ncbi:hypothetical protein HMPREF9120_00854, partial [Neisseria sp. oral taxon 020 str. F0370]
MRTGCCEGYARAYGFFAGALSHGFFQTASRYRWGVLALSLRGGFLRKNPRLQEKKHSKIGHLA